MSDSAHPVTPDGRYFVVRGRLWRRTDPSLREERRAALGAELMAARRGVDLTLRKGDATALAAARAVVVRVKTALRERGAVRWHAGLQPSHGRKHLLCRVVRADEGTIMTDDRLPDLPGAFGKPDAGDDSAFYAPPRLVTHTDAGAIAALTSLYRQMLPESGRVL